MIDHALVSPELTSAQVIEALELARRYRVASVTMRPCDVDLAVRTLGSDSVKVGSVAGFPHGTQTTAAKLYELRDLLRRGAKEISLVIAIPNLVSREFRHAQTELDQASEACHKEGALLKVILETGYLSEELKVIACRCCERAEVDIVSTSTGYGPSGYTVDDLKLLRKYLPEEIAIKAAGGVDTLDQVLEVHALGCTRVGTTSTAAILDAWDRRLQPAGTVSEPRP